MKYSLRVFTKVDLGNEEDVIAILDGQQRMTSLYIALTGSHAKKLPYYSSKNANAFPKKKLYLNLLSKSDDIELEYEFKDTEMNVKLISLEEIDKTKYRYLDSISFVLKKNIFMYLKLFLETHTIDINETFYKPS